MPDAQRCAIAGIKFGRGLATIEEELSMFEEFRQWERVRTAVSNIRDTHKELRYCIEDFPEIGEEVRQLTAACDERDWRDLRKAFYDVIRKVSKIL